MLFLLPGPLFPSLILWLILSSLSPILDVIYLKKISKSYSLSQAPLFLQNIYCNLTVLFIYCYFIILLSGYLILPVFLSVSFLRMYAAWEQGSSVLFAVVFLDLEQEDIDIGDLDIDIDIGIDIDIDTFMYTYRQALELLPVRFQTTSIKWISQ